MRVYVEYALADNLFFDWLLLFAVSLATKDRRNFWQLMAGAVVGAVGAIGISLLSWHWALLLCAKTVLLFAIVLSAFGVRNFKKLPLYALLFAMFTFALGGCIYGIFYLAKIDFEISDVFFYALNIPIGVVGAGVCFFVCSVVYFLRHINGLKKAKRFGCQVTLVLNGQSISLSGFLDSGNSLVENGLPVCFLCHTKKTAQIKRSIAQSILQGKATIKNLHFVDFFTVNGAAKTAVFEADELFVDGKKTRSWLAFGNANMKGFDLLLNVEMLSEN